MTERPQVPPAIVDRLRRVCLALPETREEEAWIGTRWRVRAKTFAHVNMVADGWPPVYARVIGLAADDDPAVVLTFRSVGDELQALGALGPPYFRGHPAPPACCSAPTPTGTRWPSSSPRATASRPRRSSPTGSTGRAADGPRAGQSSASDS